MRAVLCGVLCLIVGLACSGHQGPNVVLQSGPTLKITKVLRIGSVYLKITNSGKQALKIWEDSNSWGANDWRVLRIRHGQVDVFFQNPYQLFTANAPTTTLIAPGKHVERTLDVNGGNWCELGQCSVYNERGLGGKEIRFANDDVILIVYEVPPTKESQEMNVWSGATAAVATVK